MILMIITSEGRLILKNICMRVVGSVLINISPSNIFCRKEFTKIVRMLLDTVSIYGSSVLLKIIYTQFFIHN